MTTKGKFGDMKMMLRQAASGAIRASAGLATVLTNIVMLDWAHLARVTTAMRGLHSRHCPICDYMGNFRAFGSPPRYDAKCSNCHSLERHRLLHLALKNFHPIDFQSSLLHFAPEPAMRDFLRFRVAKYVTADLVGRHVDININIEEIALVDQSFDNIICSHVLEHVNDAKALAEMFRVLKPGGALFAMVPMIEGWKSTYENDEVDTESMREVHFGQGDHVRFYGSDIRERIVAAGFELKEFTAEGPIVINHGLWRGEKVLVCSKPLTAI